MFLSSIHRPRHSKIMHVYYYSCAMEAIGKQEIIYKFLQTNSSDCEEPSCKDNVSYMIVVPCIFLSSITLVRSYLCEYFRRYIPRIRDEFLGFHLQNSFTMLYLLVLIISHKHTHIFQNCNKTLDSYKLFRRNRQQKRGSGMVLYIRVCFNVVELRVIRLGPYW